MLDKGENIFEVAAYEKESFPLYSSWRCKLFVQASERTVVLSCLSYLSGSAAI